MTFLIALTRDLKRRDVAQRRSIFADHGAFFDWIRSVPSKGLRQFRHMLRFFAFPDRVERMSSNTHRRRILEAFGIAPERETKKWTDQQLDDALPKLRTDLTKGHLEKLLSIRSRAAPA